MQCFKLLYVMPLFVACTPHDVPISSRSAQFDHYPDQLFALFESNCSGPGESFSKTAGQSFECRELLSPETMAFVILNYGGHPQDLPYSVMRLTSKQNANGYLVDAALFFHVPQKTGGSVQVPVESNELDRTLGALYRNLGGAPTQAE